MPVQEFVAPVLISLKVVLVSSLLAFVLGVVAAWLMAKKRFPGKVFLDTVFMLPLVLPPTVVGFILLVNIGRKSWLGRLTEALFHQPLVFTWWAAAIAAAVMAFPLVYQTAKVGFLSVDKEIEDSARSMGAGEWQVFRYVTLPLAGRSLASAYILGVARGLGEFGATLMVAGNIPGKTQTVPTAIYIAVDSGKMALAWYWTASMIAISFLMLAAVNKKIG